MDAYQVYPFSAIVGQERVKQALLMNIVNAKLGGLLICGERGTAKSTLVRAIVKLVNNKKVIELPLNTTEEMVVGTVNVETAIKHGKRELDQGLLAKANGHILYIDEVNLLSDSISKLIVDSATSGVNFIEREGISKVEQAQFTLVGTMNPEEGMLSPQFLDRFGLLRFGQRRDRRKNESNHHQKPLIL